MDAQLKLWQDTIDERPKSWQETAVLRRLALDEYEVRMRESDRKLRELGVL